MITLITIELRRALSRRLVHALIGLALGLTAIAGVITFIQTGKPTADAPIALVELWPTSGEDAILGVTAFFLAVGALFAGASVAGAEWRTGSMATLLTWEPRRVRVIVARLTAVLLAASVIGLVLQVVFTLALLPALLAHGSTAGADAAWLRGLVAGVARGAALTGLAAALGASIAMIGRNTAVALGAAFVYLNVLEGVLRAWKPWLGRGLISENAVIFLTDGRGADLPFTRSTMTASFTIVAYVVAVAVVATVLFRRRDIAN
jgi:ABC-2 type transport system permease protein